MIIWLASYPKSGNTWVRTFINSILFETNETTNLNNLKIRLFPLRSDFERINIDPDDIIQFAINSINSQSLVNLDNKIKIFKTHNALWRFQNHSFTDTENTLAVIYIVRDPRNILTSVKNFFKFKDDDKALSFMTNEKQSIGLRKRGGSINLPTIVSSWSNHYSSWKKMEKNYLLIKYEDLLKNSFEEFNKIVIFLKQFYDLKIDELNIKKIVENCNFDNLKKQEDRFGFNEIIENSDDPPPKFFFLGPQNNWQKILNPKTKEKIELKFKKEMIELGYL